jgi:hypothetical protein
MRFVYTLFVVMLWSGHALAQTGFSPSECRQKCAAGDVKNGGCFSMVRHTTWGDLKSVGFFAEIMLRLKSHSTAPGAICNQRLNFNGSTVSLLGSGCKIRSSQRIGDLTVWSVKTIAGANGIISESADKKLEAHFQNGALLWDTGTMANPPFGWNSVSYLTEGTYVNGEPAAIWTDQHLCYAVRLSEAK